MSHSPADQTANRLSNANTKKLSNGVLLPQYDRAQVTNGIVHLGVGNFHRGHQAVFTDDVLASGDLSWGIIGVSLRSPRIKNILSEQDYLYSLSFRDNDTEQLRVIGSIMKVLCAPEDPESVLAAMCNPGVKIVSLTITEKGYAWPEGQIADWAPSSFAQSEASALLYIVEALYTRREHGIQPFALLSCDNLAANGKALKSAVVQLARQKDSGFASELVDCLACPSSMVDRIVPAPTATDLDASAKSLGLRDNAAVITEPFGQWVIEDDFPTDRPDWAISAGVTFTKDVAPYEQMKLRLLNGAHTFIALYGQLTGATYVSDVMRADQATNFLQNYWQNTIRTLRVDADLSDYIGRLIARFKNQNLFHKTAQIVSDTSQKMPQRIIEPLLVLQAIGGETKAHSTVIALWFEYLRCAQQVEDPLAADLVRLAQSGDLALFVKELPIFSPSYKQNEKAINELIQAYKELRDGSMTKLLSPYTKKLGAKWAICESL